MAEYLEPLSEEIQLAGNARRLTNAFVQVGFSHVEAFELTKTWFDRTLEAASRGQFNAET